MRKSDTMGKAQRCALSEIDHIRQGYRLQIIVNEFWNLWSNAYCPVSLGTMRDAIRGAVGRGNRELKQIA